LPFVGFGPGVVQLFGVPQYNASVSGGGGESVMLGSTENLLRNIQGLLKVNWEAGRRSWAPFDPSLDIFHEICFKLFHKRIEREATR
jgi:hypothetical protein